MTQTVRRLNTPRPFLKWAGGKGQLLPELMARVDAAGAFGRYHEPFIGGGALFFELSRLNRLGRKLAYLSDNNVNLIAAYEGVKADVEAVIALLREHEANHCEAYFYEMRASVPDGLAERTARLIYLNRTCYNGLYRENSRGEFNVPFGRYRNPAIVNEPNLRAVAEALQRAKLANRPFDTVVRLAEPNDLVYFDPPYHPVSKTANFTAYEKGGFGEPDQERLAEVFRALDEKGVNVLQSNSMTPFICELYTDYTVETVYATRAVNSRADRRGRIEEALIRNF